MLEWLNNNKLINPKLICAFCWFVLSIMKMHGPKNKITCLRVLGFWQRSHRGLRCWQMWQCSPWQVDPEVSKGSVAFIFNVARSMKHMKTTFPSSPKEITHPAKQCHIPEDRNPAQQACYTPDMSANRMKTISALLNAVSKKPLPALYWHTEMAVSATRCLLSRRTVNKE